MRVGIAVVLICIVLAFGLVFHAGRHYGRADYYNLRTECTHLQRANEAKNNQIAGLQAKISDLEIDKAATGRWAELMKKDNIEFRKELGLSNNSPVP